MIADPSCDTMPPKLVTVPLLLMEKGGGVKGGSPDSISDPVSVNTQVSGSVLQEVAAGSRIMANTRHNITMMAFLSQQYLVVCL